MSWRISPLVRKDWDEVWRIYLDGIGTGHATFETEAPPWERWDAAHFPRPRLAARGFGRVLGWAALAPVSARKVYAGVAEVSVYVESASRGRGVGRDLLSQLIELSEDAGFWTLQAGIFPENAASLALHKKCGFRRVGRRERFGRLRGVWRDVLLFERRSPSVGT